MIYEVVFTKNPPTERDVFYPEELTLDDWLEAHKKLVLVSGRMYLSVKDFDDLGDFISKIGKSVILHQKKPEHEYPFLEIYNDYRE